MKFICTLCNYVVDQGEGLPAAGIAPGTDFNALPDDWHCPDCAASKEFFETCSCVSLPLYEATKVTPTANRVEAA